MYDCKYCGRKMKNNSGKASHENYFCKMNEKRIIAPATASLKERAQIKFISTFEMEWEEFLLVVGLTDGASVKKRLMLEQEGRCNKCGLYEWNGKELPIELEHINGVHYDNSRDNVEVICPNCHAQTDTWRGKNKNLIGGKVSDGTLIKSLKNNTSIRQALVKCGLAGKGGNYQRCHTLIVKHQITVGSNIKIQ